MRTPPPPTSYVLTVAAPAAGSGTITSSPAGINCPSTCTASFPANTKVTLTATAGSNYSFGGWSGGCSGTGACTVTLTAAISVSAAFNAPYTLTVTAPAAGSGTVTSNPTAINCPGTCSASFPQNTQVTLTATPAANYSFAGWSGSCSGTGACSLTMTAAANVTPLFNPDYGLVVTLAGAGMGTVTSTPAGINCPTTCTSLFPQNTQVTLSETPAANTTFAGWGGACSGTAACTVTITGASSVTATFGASLQSLNHIIIFAQENRSFDHYFGAMREYWAQNSIPDQSFDGLPQFNPASGIAPLQGPAPSVPGCDPTQPYPAYSACLPDTNVQVPSFHLTSTCQEEQSPFWNESHVDWDYNDPTGQSAAALNGFVITAADDARQQSPALMDTDGLRAMGYFDGTDLNYYYFMASNFATSDRWFSPIMDRTQINRMYLLAATSAGHVHPLVAPETPLSNTTIFEALQNAGITWKIYVDTDATPCASNPTASCLLNYSYINEFTYGQTIVNSPTLSQNLVPLTQYTTDLQNGTLPQVALIEPPSPVGLDEHPNDVDTSTPINVQAGASFASGIINGLMNSSSWKDSALIFTYDEAGGFYDHVSPQPMQSPDGVQPVDIMPGDICDGTGQIGTGTCDFTYTGYRLPLIVISPFAKKNYVSHTVRDYTAILKLIETRFNLPALTQRDAAQADMSEFFDFVNIPWATPPTPPTQNTGGQCTLAPPTP